MRVKIPMRIKKLAKRLFAARQWGDLRRIEPASRSFGFDRGTPIDRVYIESFLSEHADAITGDILEIGDNQYTQKFGKHIKRSVVLAGSVPDAECYSGDLTNVQSLATLGRFDCVIATQVLNFIFELDAAMHGIKSLLKENGVVLVTLAGLAPVSRYDAERWGDYWRFSDMSAKKLFEKHFESGVDITCFGNLISATGILHGLSAEELRRDEMAHTDPDYQVLIGVKATNLARQIRL